MELIQRLIIVCVSLFVVTDNVYAAPKITEIRLKDTPSYDASPMPANEFVFRANNELYWLEGNMDKPIRHKYWISTPDFERLSALFESHGFFELKKLYDRPPGTTTYLTDGSTVTTQVTRDGQKKTVNNYSGNGPQNLWELEMLTRGFASQYIGLKRTPLSALPTPTPRPIPVIRGTNPTS